MGVDRFAVVSTVDDGYEPVDFRIEEVLLFVGNVVAEEDPVSSLRTQSRLDQSWQSADLLLSKRSASSACTTGCRGRVSTRSRKKSGRL